ncbi:Uncharacterised protein [uncultured archaeon]|nr:Uncharacterised protein [uncultured archaeon]
MKKLVFQMMISLDGYFEGLNADLGWHGPMVDAEFNEYAVKFLDTLDGLVFGRRTYQMMAAYWPTEAAIKDDPEVAKRMNGLKKFVFSNSLKKTGWENTVLLKGNAAEEVAKLKKKYNLAIFGSSDLAVQLLGKGVIDEYRIMINPVVLGAGKPLFSGITEEFRLEFVKSEVFKSGLVTITYREKKKK